MGKAIKFLAPYQVGVEDYPERPLQPDEVRLATLYSGISAGTELSHYRGTNPGVSKKYDPASRLFRPAEATNWYPRSSGYEEVGRVAETGSAVEDIRVGDVVFGTWQHLSTHIMKGETARKQRLLPGLDPVQGIFSQIGAIALNGILDARINVGEVVAVFGQGTPGLIATQLAKLSGATVVAVDMYPKRLELAASLGADVCLNPREVSPAEEIKRLTANRGADVCVEISGTGPALQEAIRSVAYAGDVITLGFIQGEAKGLYLGEEFHHNRVRIICSQIGGINPVYTHRWDRARLDRTIMELQQRGALRLQEIITGIYLYTDAAKAYIDLDQRPGEVIQSVLDFRDGGLT